MALELDSSVMTAKSEGGQKYIGITPVNVVTVNPTKEELEAIYGRKMEKEPQYVFEKDDRKSVLIDFIVKPTNDFMTFEKPIYTHVRFFISNELKVNKGRATVIDQFGETASLSSDEFKMNMVNPKSRCRGTFHVARRGEPELIKFLRCWFDLLDSTTWVSDHWELKDEVTLKKSQMPYDWNQWLAGDVSDIRSFVKPFESKRLIIAYGVKKGSNGFFNQEIFTKWFLRSWEKVDWLKKKINDYLDFSYEKKDADGNPVLGEDGKPIVINMKDIAKFDVDWIRKFELPTEEVSENTSEAPVEVQNTPTETKVDGNATKVEQMPSFDDFVKQDDGFDVIDLPF